MAPEEPVDVFVCYSHQDDEWLQLLLPHLQALETQGCCTYFCDTRFEAGDDFSAAIDRAVRSARVFLFLVSADSLASGFIFEREVGVARERAACDELVILPLLVRNAPWEECKWLSVRQFAGQQRKARGVTALAALPRSDVDDVLKEVASRIARLTEAEPHPKGGDPAAREIARLCGRDEQFVEYNVWKLTRPERGRPPQIWFVFGEEKEEITGFCERLFHEQVCKHLGNLVEPAPSLWPVEWPRGTGAARSAGERLLKTVIKDTDSLLHGPEWTATAGQTLAEAIWEKRACYSALGYHHHAELVEDFDDLFHILDDYVPLLEASSARLTELAEGGTPPLLCFFIGISFERTRSWTWWPRWPAQSKRWPFSQRWPFFLSRAARIRRDAQRRSRAGSEAVRSYHVGCLQELRSVGKVAVRNWFRKNCPNYDCVAATDKIFGKHKHLPMRTLQPKLALAYKFSANSAHP